MSQSPDGAAQQAPNPTASLADLSPEQQAAITARMNELGPEGFSQLLAGGVAQPKSPAAAQPRQREPQQVRTTAPAVQTLQPIGNARRAPPAPQADDPYAALDELGAGFHQLFAERTPVAIYGVSLVATAKGWTVAANLDGEGSQVIGREGTSAQLGVALREVMREIMDLGKEG